MSLRGDMCVCVRACEHVCVCVVGVHGSRLPGAEFSFKARERHLTQHG